MIDASPTIPPLMPIFDWQARLYDRIQDVLDWVQDELDRPVPLARYEPFAVPEPAPQPAPAGLRRHGRWIVPAPDGRGCWLAPWLLTLVEVSWNMPKYTLTLLGGGALMAGAVWLPGWGLAFAVLSTACAYLALRCCVALVQTDWHAVWRDLTRELRGLRRRSVRPARRLRLGSKSVPVGRSGWAA